MSLEAERIRERRRRIDRRVDDDEFRC